MADIKAPCGGIVLDDTQFNIDEDGVIHVTGGSGGGEVTSVNGQTGAVVLTAADVEADATGTATSEIATHNNSNSAHNDIRTQITSLNATSVGADPAGTATSTVNTHNASGTAHEDIRTEIEGLTAADVGADASGTASSAVNTHNTSDTAHNDIRTSINNIISGEYFSTNGSLLSTDKQSSGVTVSITPMSAITDATGADDVVTQFNALLAAMRTAGLIANS